MDRVAENRADCVAVAFDREIERIVAAASQRRIQLAVADDAPKSCLIAQKRNGIVHHCVPLVVVSSEHAVISLLPRRNITHPLDGGSANPEIALTVHSGRCSAAGFETR
ncbi:hypothetical protein ABQE62_17515 [Mycolicibacterium fortuitum]